MTRFADRLDFLVAAGSSAFEGLLSDLEPEWLAAAIASADSEAWRRRKLPAELVIVLVLAMALFRDRCIQAVVSHLGLTVDGQSVVASAIVKARYRVGAGPLECVFRMSAERWIEKAPENRYAGLRVLAIDGTHMRVPDSDENDEFFGRPGARSGLVGGYPQVRLAVVLDVESRLLCDANFVPWDRSETDACAPLWDRLPTDSVVILDRGFPSWTTVAGYFGEHKQRHALVRLRSNQRFDCVEALPDGSYLSQWAAPSAVKARLRADETPIPRPELVRVIEWKTAAGESARLVTTLLDPVLYPAEELVELYANRWEIETSFDELKYHLDPDHLTLRSVKPGGIAQEIWGYLALYNLIRYEMTRVATLHTVEPRRVSFQNTYLMLQAVWIMAANSDDLTSAAHFLERQERNVGLLILPPRRKRTYGRVVKVKMSNYAKKPVEPERIDRHHRKKDERAAARSGSKQPK